MKRLIAKDRSTNHIQESDIHRHGASKTRKNIIYPDSDGKHIADNTRQFDWIVKIKENLERMYRDDPHVFIAGDMLWYSVEGNNKIRTAPDTMVVFGRPKGHRGSYRSWEENDIAPQVVFEILSPGYRRTEMEQKFLFYQKYAKEYGADRDRFEKEASFCIHCGLCVHYCAEIKQKNAIGFVNRGIRKEISFISEISAKEC